MNGVIGGRKANVVHEMPIKITTLAVLSVSRRFLFFLFFPKISTSLRVKNGPKLVTEKNLSQSCLADGQEQDAIDRAVGVIARGVTTAKYIKTR